MKKGILTILIIAMMYAGFAQRANKDSISGNYQNMLRETVGQLLRLEAGRDAGTYYFKVTDAIYAQALLITQAEINHEGSSGNTAFLNTLQTLVYKLRNDLVNGQRTLRGLAVPRNYPSAVSSALRNFSRYEQPAGLQRQSAYLWVMIQVFENLNQINVALLQAELNTGQRNAVMKRLMVQRQIVDQLKNK